MSGLPPDNKIPPYILVVLAVLGGGGAGFSLQPESADADRLTRAAESPEVAEAETRTAALQVASLVEPSGI